MQPTARFLLTVLIIVISSGLAGAADPSFYIRRDGRRLTVSGREIRLRGVCFGNKVWENVEIPVEHHSYLDYRRVKAMGMNAVRFYLNYRTFEDDSRPYAYKESGFEWIDQNIRWARENGIYLILNMHVPQGGFQFLGQGEALWKDRNNQRRLIALWAAIARRYRDETTVAGYDILNEPTPDQSVEQWRDLAIAIVRVIRSQDPNHLIIVEKAMGIMGRPVPANPAENFFLVPDTNAAYTFHFYEPVEFTYQGLAFIGLTNAAKYPDGSRSVPPADMEWSWAALENPVLPSGTTGWRTYEGIPCPATNSAWTFAIPVFQSARNSGAALFRSFEIREYDARGRFLGTIRRSGIDTNRRWIFWSGDGSGWMVTGQESGKTYLKIAATKGEAAAYDPSLGFAVKTGHSYQIVGEMSGSFVTADAQCRLRIDFYKSPSGAKLMTWNRDYLENELEKYIRFGRTNNVPLYVGEFGADAPAFDDGRGGIQWVRDLLFLFKLYDLNFTYHAYHEGLFGIYRNDECLPMEERRNDALVELFRKELD